MSSISRSEPEIRPVLSTNITVRYGRGPDVLSGAVLEVLPGEVVGLVGQSGSGKSTLALSIMGLLSPRAAAVSGTVSLLGQNLTGLSERDLRSVRGRLVSLVPQSPAAALNPALKIETHLREAWRAHSRANWNEGLYRARGLLGSCGLPQTDEFLRRYPRQISVGQAQRVVIAMAMLHRPALILADEPTSALDLLTQGAVLRLIARINAEQGAGVLFISHDLLAVSTICHRIAILFSGKVVEFGLADQILNSPSHPHTRELTAAIPAWGSRIKSD